METVLAIYVLDELHWFPVYKRIVFSLLLHVYPSVNQLVPAYLCGLITPYKEAQRCDDLRSTVQHVFHTLRSGSMLFGDRSFRVAGPTEWNFLTLRYQAGKCICDCQTQSKDTSFSATFWINK